MDGLREIIRANKKAKAKFDRIKKGLQKAPNYMEAHQKRRS